MVDTGRNSKSMPPKINSVFIPPDGKDAAKSMCDICKKYRVFYGNERRCPDCGSKEEIKDKDSGDYLKNEFEVSPMIAHKEDPKKKRSPDFPAGATIISDEEVSRT